MDERTEILLINPSGWQNESVNLGLCYLAGALSAVGRSCAILDLIRYQFSDDDLVARAVALRPRVVGFSAKTATANEAARLAELLKVHLPEATFIVGGPHVTLCAGEYLSAHAVFDFGILGEGEQAVVSLVDAVVGGSATDAINGVAFRTAGAVQVNPWRPPENLDALPRPDLDAIDGFTWAGFRYPLVTSRGCPFECIYCCVNKLTGSRRWRARSAASVADELESVAREKGVTRFEIWDDNFTLDLNRAKAICRELIDRKLHLSWYCHNGIRADRLDAELASLMAAAGCTSVAFGIESGNPETFDAIKKGEPLSAVVRAVELVKSAGIKPVGYFIIGLPGDTLDRFVETVRFQRSLGLWHHVFGMLIPYPQTEVWEIVQSQGRLLCDITQTQHFSDEVVRPSFELPAFPRQDMVRAYYIARYFELFEAVSAVRAVGKMPRIAFLTTPELVPHLAGMFLACGNDVEISVLGTEFAQEVRGAGAYEELPADVRVTFVDGPAVWTGPSGPAGVFVGEARMLKRHLLVRNAEIVAWTASDAGHPLQRLKRCTGPGRSLVAGVCGLLRAACCRGGAMRGRWFAPRAGMTQRVKALLRPWRDRAVKCVSLAMFVVTKRRIRGLSPTKRSFPYEDHPSYL